MALAAVIAWVIRTTPGAGVGLLGLVAGGIAAWGGLLLLAAGRGWTRAVGAGVFGVVVVLGVVGSWLGRGRAEAVGRVGLWAVAASD